MSEIKATKPAREVDAVAVEEVRPAIASGTQPTTAKKTVSAKDLEAAKTKKLVTRSRSQGDQRLMETSTAKATFNTIRGILPAPRIPDASEPENYELVQS
jgi:hypothetical protein